MAKCICWLPGSGAATDHLSEQQWLVGWAPLSSSCEDPQHKEEEPPLSEGATEHGLNNCSDLSAPLSSPSSRRYGIYLTDYIIAHSLNISVFKKKLLFFEKVSKLQNS